LAIILGSCASYKDLMIANGDQNDAVKNAIYDFVKKSRLSKKSDVFKVNITHVNDKVLAVSIIEAVDKLMPDPDNKIGTSHSNFPTRYLEQEGKLFYWYDSTDVITLRLISVLSEYNQIDSTNVNSIVEIKGTLNESLKGVDYFFCKKNLLKFKRVVTDRAVGWYDPPKLNCK
jgi:hypothetical protein